MQRPNAIIAQRDAQSAAMIAAQLQNHCRSVYVAISPEEIKQAVPKHRADIVIADLEVMSLDRVKQLHDEFGGVQIVCTHRLADEELWAQSLEAGAADCCSTDDVKGILRAALQNMKLARSKAA